MHIYIYKLYNKNYNLYVITKYVAYYIFIIIDDYQLIAAALRR